MTAVGYGDPSPEAQAEFARLWPADLHLVGKEITRFHCVYWPAFLLAAGLPLPKQITANGWLLFDNAKMSKSRGNIVRTETILDAFGDHVYGKQFPDSTKAERDLFAADVLRYFLLREIPFGQDGSFSFDALVTRYNADLANGYGNLASRTLKMIDQYFAGEIPTPQASIRASGADSLIDYEQQQKQLNAHYLRPEVINTFAGQWLAPALIESFAEADSSLADAVQNIELDTGFTKALSEMLAVVTHVDGELSAFAPWKQIKDPEQKQLVADHLYIAAEYIRLATTLLYAFIPYATAKVWAQLGLGDIEQAARSGKLRTLTWGGLQPGTKLGPLAPIFPRADKGLAQLMIDMEETRTNPVPSATNTPAIASSDPAAPPRTSEADPIAATALPVAGSTADTTGRSTTEPTSAPTETPAPTGPTGPADAEPQIAIDDFIKVELRVAQILVAERIPKADKLLRLEVDLGYEKRQILSGIAQWYTPEESDRPPHRDRSEPRPPQDARPGIPRHAAGCQRRPRR